MKGYKIDLTAYQFNQMEEITRETEDGKIIRTGEMGMKMITVEPAHYLVWMFGNPNIAEEDHKKASRKFDIYELGAILSKIQVAGESVILSKDQIDRMKERAVVVRPHLSMRHYEMIRRVMEPEEVELAEKKPETKPKDSKK